MVLFKVITKLKNSITAADPTLTDQVILDLYNQVNNIEKKVKSRIEIITLERELHKSAAEDWKKKHDVLKDKLKSLGVE